jgi:hypothetical protein
MPGCSRMVQQDRVRAEVVGEDVGNDADGGALADEVLFEQLVAHALDGFLDVGGEGHFDRAHAVGYVNSSLALLPATR